MMSFEDPKTDEYQKRILQLENTIRKQMEIIFQQAELLQRQDAMLNALNEMATAELPIEQMKIGRIHDCTRVLGVEQGYLGLPVHDGAYLDTAGNPSIPYMDSCWEFSDEQRAAIAGGAPMILRCLAERTQHPPVQLLIGTRIQLN